MAEIKVLTPSGKGMWSWIYLGPGLSRHVCDSSPCDSSLGESLCGQPEKDQEDH